MPHNGRALPAIRLGSSKSHVKVLQAMARQLRLHVPGGFYHVTLRGNHRQPVFRTERDRDTLDGIVADALDVLDARIHAFCWMTNHIHMLVQVSAEPLGKLVLRIASQYARRFQARLDTTGHLFERRHHAVLVDADRYLLTLVRYIHMNPVRGGLVRRPDDYTWSSHRDYLGEPRHPWVHTAFTLNLLSATNSRARAAYRQLMNSTDEVKWGSGTLVPNPDNPQVLGCDAFIRTIRAPALRPSGTSTLEELVLECASRFNLSAAEITSASRSRDKSAARVWLVREALGRGIASTSTVARRLQRSEAALRGLLARRLRQRAQ